MTPEQKARLQTILDEYNMAIAAIKEADANAGSTMATTDARRTARDPEEERTQRFEAIMAEARQQVAVHERIAEANRRANDQVRLLLNDL